MVARPPDGRGQQSHRGAGSTTRRCNASGLSPVSVRWGWAGSRWAKARQTLSPQSPPRLVVWCSKSS
eukprot:8776565-Lingulodinium_polyedra.AAC.1